MSSLPEVIFITTESSTTYEKSRNQALPMSLLRENIQKKWHCQEARSYVTCWTKSGEQFYYNRFHWQLLNFFAAVEKLINFEKKLCWYLIHHSMQDFHASLHEIESLKCCYMQCMSVSRGSLWGILLCTLFQTVISLRVYTTVYGNVCRHMRIEKILTKRRVLNFSVVIVF